jgi:Holliday junction resolvase-like predicted endonuclease
MGTQGLAEGLFSGIASIWWVIPLAFAIMYIKIKIEKKEKEYKDKKRAEAKEKKQNDKKQKEELIKKFPDMAYLPNHEPVKDKKIKETEQKREYTAEEKREYANRQREFREKISQKGKDYEEFTANHYRSSGYEVLEHGKEYGKLDKGIDLIAKKDKEVIFIQCKNWRADGKVKIDHVKIKEFIGNVAAFLEKNTVYKDYEVKRIFAVAEPVLDKSAIEYIKANKNIVRYLHLPMP